ncbi:50S ribosomal protein L1 [Patescibacteria group bacterium]
MKSHGKRYTAMKDAVPSEPQELTQALEFVLNNTSEKFDESVEVHIRLGVDPTKSDQMVRGTVNLPHGTGKSLKVAAFVPEKLEKEAKEAGAEVVGGEALIEQIEKKPEINFEVAVATPEMMPKLAKIAKILGPKGLLPNPKNETVGPDVKKLVEGLKAGKAAYRMDEQGNIHQSVGKVSFGADKLKENADAFLEAVQKAKPESTKGSYIKGKYLCSTMGPSIPLI